MCSERGKQVSNFQNSVPVNMNYLNKNLTNKTGECKYNDFNFLHFNNIGKR